MPGADICGQLVDCGGDATLVVHEGADLEAALARDGPFARAREHQRPRAQLRLVAGNLSIFLDAAKWTRMAKTTGRVSVRRRPQVSSSF